MKQSPSTQKILHAVTSGIIVLAALLHIVAMLVDYEPTTQYFRPGAWLPTAALGCAVMAGILGTVGILCTFPKKFEGTLFVHRNRFNPSTVGFALMALFLLESPVRSFRTPAVIFLFLAAVYTFLCGLPKLRQYKDGLVILGFAPILACASLVAYYYFDMSVEMNTPVKIALQIGLAMVMFCYTGELRFLLGRAMPRAYLILHTWAHAIGALSAVSVPIAFLCNKFERADYAAGAILIFSIVLTQHRQVRRLRRGTEQINEAAEQSEAEPAVTNESIDESRTDEQ